MISIGSVYRPTISRHFPQFHSTPPCEMLGKHLAPSRSSARPFASLQVERSLASTACLGYRKGGPAKRLGQCRVVAYCAQLGPPQSVCCRVAFSKFDG